MNYSILILQAQFDQQEALKKDFLNRKGQLNPDGKRSINIPLEQIQKNISELQKSIKILEEYFDPIVGRQQIKFHCSGCLSFDLKNGDKIFELSFESNYSESKYFINLTLQEMQKNPFIKTTKFSVFEMLDLMNKFSKNKINTK